MLTSCLSLTTAANKTQVYNCNVQQAQAHWHQLTVCVSSGFWCNSVLALGLVKASGGKQRVCMATQMH